MGPGPRDSVGEFSMPQKAAGSIASQAHSQVWVQSFLSLSKVK